MRYFTQKNRPAWQWRSREKGGKWAHAPWGVGLGGRISTLFAAT